MLAIITSIGEPTTDLCEWALKRNGFDTKVIYGSSTLQQKLAQIYRDTDKDFLRVDADVIVNRNCVYTWGRVMMFAEQWWTQYLTFDWYKQDVTTGGVQLIQKEAIPILRDNVDRFVAAERPETELYRLDEFHNPRRCATQPIIMGIHGYGQTDINRVESIKKGRNQDGYDFELVRKLNEI